MRKSLWIKNLIEHGLITVTAYVECESFYRSVPTSDPVWHDDLFKHIEYFNIKSTVNGMIWKEYANIYDKSNVIELSEKTIYETSEYIKKLANEKPETAFTDKMNLLFKGE